MAHPFTRSLTVLAVLAAATACGSDAREAGTSPTDPVVVETDVAAELTEALEGLPILAVTAAVPATLENLTVVAETWIVGEVAAVHNPVVRTVSTNEVACEEAEGVPTGEMCETSLRMMFVDVEISVDEILATRSDDVAETVTVSIAVDTVPDGQDSADGIELREAAAEHLVSAIPIGTTLVAAVTPVGEHTEANAIGVVADDGTIHPANSIPSDGDEPVGLGEVASVEELRGRLA